MDGLSQERIQKLIKQIKTKYKFSPIKRIYIDKNSANPNPNTNKIATKLYKQGQLTKEKIKELNIRPLGIPTFNDRIVQEAIRQILEAIYEPLFEAIDLNHGFRPKKSPHTTIIKITQKAKAMTTAIEGDIQSAFDSLNFDKFIEILKRKISDVKFIKLIRQGLECGVFFGNTMEATKIGVTQGSITGPIIWNIYMHEFDHFILNLINQEQQQNIQEGRKTKVVNSTYNTTSKNKSLTKKIIKELQQQPQTKENIDSIKFYKNKYIQLDKKQKSLSPMNYGKMLRRTFYIRYADDWIILNNSNIKYNKKIIDKISDFLSDELKLTLSNTKTKITNTRGITPIKFLGFQIRYEKPRMQSTWKGKYKKIKTDITNRTKIKLKQTSDTAFKQRSANPSPIVAWDRKKILKRLEDKGFIKKYSNTYRGTRKKIWTILQPHEIIQRYNWIIRGYITYYSPVTTYANDIFFLHYLLTYSCLHTLANKFNSKLSSIIKKFGLSPKINYKEKTITNKTTVKEITKTIKLIDWQEAKNIINQGIINIKKKNIIPTNHYSTILNEKINFRTQYKLGKYCCICGSQEQIEYHHVRHIRKGKTTGFLQILNQLNRKQIPVCKDCHIKIHKGIYDSLKLTELFDSELIIL